MLTQTLFKKKYTVREKKKRQQKGKKGKEEISADHEPPIATSVVEDGLRMGRRLEKGDLVRGICSHPSERALAWR